MGGIFTGSGTILKRYLVRFRFQRGSETHPRARVNIVNIGERGIGYKTL